jgi:nicotinic acid phosphoribosyltransferase
VVASKKVEAGGFWVLRPDSGDPVEVVLQVWGLFAVAAVLQLTRAAALWACAAGPPCTGPRVRV